jgi:hypothetical protein
MAGRRIVLAASSYCKVVCCSPNAFHKQLDWDSIILFGIYPFFIGTDRSSKQWATTRLLQVSGHYIFVGI